MNGERALRILGQHAQGDRGRIELANHDGEVILRVYEGRDIFKGRGRNLCDAIEDAIESDGWCPP